MNSNVKDLETRGFVVLPSFLSGPELELFRSDFSDQPLAANGNYPITAMSPEANARFTERVEEVLGLVNTQTDLKVDLPTAGMYFATGAKRGMFFPWHQDHESFFQVQNHYDYLNFYIPIIKPRKDKSNLSVVPFDALERECPATFRQVVGSGAREFHRFGKRQIIVANDSGTAHFIDDDIDRVAETPALAAGDLLLLRGDIIHKTEDADTERVALSFRATSTRTVIRHSRLADGGLNKALTMANNPESYQRMFKAFEKVKKDELSVAELKAVMDTVTVTPPERRRDFLKILLGEKRKAHVLGRFVRSLAYMQWFGAWLKLLGAYSRYQARRQAS